MRVRGAGPDDVEAVLSMRLAFLAEFRGVDPAGFGSVFVRRTREFIASGQRRGDFVSWVAEIGSTPVGVVSLQIREVPPRHDDERSREGHVLNMYVEPPHRRHGIGRALMDTCLASASRHQVRLFTLKATQSGRALYETVGFEDPGDFMQLLVDA